MRLKRKVRDGSVAALLCAALCLASFTIHAQDDGKKTILEQLNEAPRLKEELDVRNRKLQEEREARLRKLEKLSPEQREEFLCKELEEQSAHTAHCQSHYVRRGYKETWGGVIGIDFGIVIMEGAGGAVLCSLGPVLGRPVPCVPLKRVE